MVLNLRFQSERALFQFLTRGQIRRTELQPAFESPVRPEKPGLVEALFVHHPFSSLLAQPEAQGLEPPALVSDLHLELTHGPHYLGWIDP